MSDYEKGLYSNQPKSNFQSGSQEWAGAQAAEMMRARQAEWDRQAQQQRDDGNRRSQQNNYGGGGGGGAGRPIAGFIALCVVGFICYVIFANPTPNKPTTSMTVGAYRVRPCQFTAADGVSSRGLVDNEWVRVQKVDGSVLEVAVNRRTNDGQSTDGSIRGTIGSACLKAVR